MKNINRTNLLYRIFGLALTFCLAFGILTVVVPMKTAAATPGHTLVGAIRWDAWAGNTGSMGYISEQSRKMLSPEKFRFRTPFFATITGENSIGIETTQASMDQEIEYAKNSGIDYWAFQWYGQGWGFDIALNKYLSSAHKDAVAAICLKKSV